VGEWISPDGINLEAVPNDPYDIVLRDANNPGQLLITTPVTNPSIKAADEGVYTCVIPDETGVSQYLHIGIYLSIGKWRLIC